MAASSSRGPHKYPFGPSSVATCSLLSRSKLNPFRCSRDWNEFLREEKCGGCTQREQRRRLSTHEEAVHTHTL